MKEYIKKFESAAAADNYPIIDIPFTTSIMANPIQNLVCNRAGMKLVNNNGVVCVVPDGQTVIPIVPIFYIYLIYLAVLGLTGEHDITEKIRESNVCEGIDGYWFLKYPNELLNFNIHNVYDFFESIDESGAHKNNMYNSPIYDNSTILNPDNFRFAENFLAWHNLSLNDFSSFPAMDPDIVMLGMNSLFNIDLQEQDEQGNFIYDFNDGNMNFYTDINDCISDFSPYADNINDFYTALDKEYPVKSIFVLECNSNMIEYVVAHGLPMCKLVVCFITEAYSYFCPIDARFPKSLPE